MYKNSQSDDLINSKWLYERVVNIPLALQNEKIILIGGGGHCKSVIDVIEQEGKFQIAGIIDKQGNISKVLGYPIIGNDDLKNYLMNINML